MWLSIGLALDKLCRVKHYRNNYMIISSTKNTIIPVQLKFKTAVIIT